MGMLRRIATVPLLALFFAAPAHAIGGPSIPTTLTQAVTSAHFVVHYTTAAGSPDAIATSTAQTLAANAEHALAVETGWGWPGFKDDGDGHEDIYVFAFGGAAGYEVPLTYDAQTTSNILIETQAAADPFTIAHELFHTLQAADDDYSGSMLMESSANWAGYGVVGGNVGSSDSLYLQHPETPLDCSTNGANGAPACPASFGDLGYSRWLWWSYLESLYGKGIVKDVFDYGASAHGYPSAAALLDGALQLHGSSLAGAYGDFAVANLLRTYPGAANAYWKVTPRPVPASASTSFALDHLTTSYFTLQPASSTCSTQQLHVAVTAAPTIANVTLVLGGAIAATGTTIDASWNTCTPARIVVSNTSLADAQPIVLTTSLGGAATTTTTTTTAKAAPPGDAAPSLQLLGIGASIPVSSSKPNLALSVSSNAPGTVELGVDGTTVLATRDVQPGTNTLRLLLPKGLKGRKTLLVTGISPGGTRGVTLRVTLTFAR